MSEDSRAEALYTEAEHTLDTMRQDAQRWRYFAARVALMLGTTVEEMAAEIDAAIATSNRAAAPDQH